MSDRDRQSPYDRSHQQGGGNAWGDNDTPRQANQWQTDGDRQQGGGGTRGGGQRGGSDDYSRDYRFSAQGDFEDRDGSGGRSYRSRLDDDFLRNDQRDASRNYERARGGYSEHRDRDQQRDGGNSSLRNYAGRDFDASGGNDFGNFTSEDYGGRDFSNRGGTAAGGARSSGSYRPSYGVGSWLRGDDDDDRGSSRHSGRDANRGREDYGSWRQYGESRGFLERAGDEIASWFGNEDASRRRDRDHREEAGPNGPGSTSQSHRGRGPSNYTRSDERIREDANDHLTHDWAVDATHVTVSVKDGELTLDGTVDSRQAKRRAEDAVEHVAGVKHVQNNLRVQERSSSFGGSGNGGSAQSSSYGASSGLTGSSAAIAGSQAGSGQTASASTSATGTTGAGTTGANTTGGIGSTAGAGGTTASRLGEKTS